MPTLVFVITALVAANIAYSGHVAYRMSRDLNGGGHPTLTHALVTFVLGLVAVGVVVARDGFGWLAGGLATAVALTTAVHVWVLSACTRWGEHRRGARRRAARSLSEIRLTPTD